MLITEDLARRVREIEIVARRMADEAMAGEYHSVFKGRGMEFDEVRPYAEGDDVRTIDWNVTARTGFPHVKRFVEERELTVVLAVDASGSLDFGTRGRMKGEMAVEVCALLAFAAIRNNDRVGLLIFTDEIELYLPPKRGRRHVLRVIRELLGFRRRRRGTDLAGALEYLRRLHRRKAVIFCLSDFLEEGIETPLKLLSMHHDLIPIVLRDRREETLPRAGLLEIEDAETGETVVIDTSSGRVRRAFEEQRRDARQRRVAMLRRLDVDSVELETGEDYVPPIVRLFRRRARQP
jgi:uncharacterized protein (DUF58 family)